MLWKGQPLWSVFFMPHWNLLLFTHLIVFSFRTCFKDVHNTEVTLADASLPGSLLLPFLQEKYCVYCFWFQIWQICLSAADLCCWTWEFFMPISHYSGALFFCLPLFIYIRTSEVSFHTSCSSFNLHTFYTFSAMNHPVLTYVFLQSPC